MNRPWWKDDNPPPCLLNVLERGVEAGVDSAETLRNTLRIANIVSTWFNNRRGATLAKLEKALLKWNEKNHRQMTREEIMVAVNNRDKFGRCSEIQQISDLSIHCDIDLCGSTEAQLNELQHRIKDETTDVVYFEGPSPVIFRVSLMSEVFECTTEQILNPKKFQIWFFEHFFLTVDFSRKAWNYLIEYWGAMARPIASDIISEDNDLIETILRNIRFLARSTSDDELMTNEQVMIVEDDVVLVKNTTIKDILKNERSKVSLRKLRSILNDFVVGDTITRRIGKSVERFWQFDPDKCGIELDKGTLDGYGLDEDERH